MAKSFFKNKAVIWLGAFWVLLMVVFLGREFYRKYLIDQEIATLQNEIDLLQDENTEVLELINYYKTSEYKERQARSLLNLQKEGEFVVALPDLSTSTDEQSTRINTEVSSFIKWWNYFFNKEDA